MKEDSIIPSALRSPSFVVFFDLRHMFLFDIPTKEIFGFILRRGYTDLSRQGPWIMRQGSPE